MGFMLQKVAPFFNWYLLAPTLPLIISILYFVASPKEEGFLARLLVSAHGASITFIFLAVLFISYFHKSNPIFGLPFMLCILLPIGLILISASRFRGPSALHLLQLINLCCLAWIAFIGLMAVTGDWL
jgi:hypothetical protein